MYRNHCNAVQWSLISLWQCALIKCCIAIKSATSIQWHGSPLMFSVQMHVTSFMQLPESPAESRIYYIKLQCPFLCVWMCVRACVSVLPFFFDTTVRLQPNLASMCGLIMNCPENQFLKCNPPPHPVGWGWKF